jgi:hypothetical protein
MAEWTKICCAVDFSDASRFAMAEAADLARRLIRDAPCPVLVIRQKEITEATLAREAVRSAAI